MTEKGNCLINKIFAEEISNSGENPTIKVTVCSGDLKDSFSVPSGASTGIHEAHELKDKDGRGMQNAINKVNNVEKNLLYFDRFFSAEPVSGAVVVAELLPFWDGAFD